MEIPGAIFVGLIIILFVVSVLTLFGSCKDAIDDDYMAEQERMRRIIEIDETESM